MVVTANTTRMFRGQITFLSETRYNLAVADHRFVDLIDYVPPSTHMYPPLPAIPGVSQERAIQARKRKSRRAIQVREAKRYRAEQRALKRQQQEYDELRKKEVSKVGHAKGLFGLLWWCLRKCEWTTNYNLLRTLRTAAVLTDMIFKLYRVVPWVQHGVRHLYEIRYARRHAFVRTRGVHHLRGIRKEDAQRKKVTSEERTDDVQEDAPSKERTDDVQEDPEDAPSKEVRIKGSKTYAQRNADQRLIVRNLYQRMIIEDVSKELKMARDAAAEWASLSKANPTDWNVHMLEHSRRSMFIQNVYQEDRAKGFHFFLVWCLHHSDKAKCLTCSHHSVKTKYATVRIRRVASRIVDYVFDLYRAVPWCLDLDGKKQVT